METTFYNKVPYSRAGSMVSEPQILASPFSPAGQERSPKSATKNSILIINQANLNRLWRILLDKRLRSLKNIRWDLEK